MHELAVHTGVWLSISETKRSATLHVSHDLGRTLRYISTTMLLYRIEKYRIVNVLRVFLKMNHSHKCISYCV